MTSSTAARPGFDPPDERPTSASRSLPGDSTVSLGRPRRYLLNSAVITAPGLYDYSLFTDAMAAMWYNGTRHCELCGRVFSVERAWPCLAQLPDQYACRGPVEPPASTIGYAETAAALSALLGVAIPVDRRSVTMEAGDEALVFRLVFPPGTPRIDPRDKGALGAALLAGHYELGLLVRTA